MITAQSQRNPVTEAKGDHFMKTLILKSVAVLLPITGFTQSPDCSAPQTQMEMNDCASRAYASADALLNNTWKIAIRDAKNRDTYLEVGDIPSEDMLRTAQRTWIKYRDQACLVESTIPRGGSIQPLIEYTCLERLTLNRVEDLEFFQGPD